MKYNADKYSAAHGADFICANFFQLCPILKPDLIFLSPPWGGPSYIEGDCYDLKRISIEDMDGLAILERALEITPNVVYFLPKNTNLSIIRRKIKKPWQVNIPRILY